VQIRKVLLGGAMAAIAFACFASGPRADFKAPAVGTAWVLQQQGTGSYSALPPEVAIRVARSSWKGEDALAFQEATRSLLLRQDSAMLAFVDAEGKPVISWDPPSRWDWPLEVGKKWHRPFKVTLHAHGVTLAGDVSGVVEAYEDVTVPAGTFKAFRVSITDTLHNDEIAWFSPELGMVVKRVQVRTERNQAGPGRRETALKSFTPAR